MLQTAMNCSTLREQRKSPQAVRQIRCEWLRQRLPKELSDFRVRCDAVSYPENVRLNSSCVPSVLVCCDSD